MFDHNGKVAVKKLASIIPTSIRPFVTTLMLFVHRELCGINIFLQRSEKKLQRNRGVKMYCSHTDYGLVRFSGPSGWLEMSEFFSLIEWSVMKSKPRHMLTSTLIDAGNKKNDFLSS